MGRVTKQAIRRYLRDHVGIVELAQELGARLRRAGPSRMTAVCINPAHADSEEGGGSLSVTSDYGRWQCFGNCRPGSRGMTEGDIFDLWGLANGLSPLESNYANRTLAGVAELRQGLLDAACPGWRDVLLGRGRSILTHWAPVLDRLASANVPGWLARAAGEDISAWEITDLQSARNLLFACGSGRLRAEAAGVPLFVLGVPRLDVLCVFTPEFEWLGGVSAPGNPRSEDFAIRTSYEWLMTGYELGGACGGSVPYRPLQVMLVVESPLDYLVLDRARLPAVLGRWQPGAATRIRLLPVAGRILCLAALAVGAGDVPARLAAVLEQGPVDWVPRCVDFSDVSTLARLPTPGQEVAARLAASSVSSCP